jgi:hypothetical protein
LEFIIGSLRPEVSAMRKARKREFGVVERVASNLLKSRFSQMRNAYHKRQRSQALPLPTDPTFAGYQPQGTA